jgi:hypothetical protein
MVDVVHGGPVENEIKKPSNFVGKLFRDGGVFLLGGLRHKSPLDQDDH